MLLYLSILRYIKSLCNNDDVCAVTAKGNQHGAADAAYAVATSGGHRWPSLTIDFRFKFCTTSCRSLSLPPSLRITTKKKEGKLGKNVEKHRNGWNVWPKRKGKWLKAARPWQRCQQIWQNGCRATQWAQANQVNNNKAPEKHACMCVFTHTNVVSRKKWLSLFPTPGLRSIFLCKKCILDKGEETCHLICVLFNYLSELKGYLILKLFSHHIGGIKKYFINLKVVKSNVIIKTWFGNIYLFFSGTLNVCYQCHLFSYILKFLLLFYHFNFMQSLGNYSVFPSIYSSL